MVAHDVETYLQQLFTLMLAYSLLASARAGAPEAAQETLSSDSTKFVQVPFGRCSRLLLQGSQGASLRGMRTGSSISASPAPASAKEDSGSQLMLGNPISGKQVAKVMCDGTKLRANRGVRHVWHVRIEVALGGGQPLAGAGSLFTNQGSPHG